MKKVFLIVLLVAMFVGAAAVSADPHNGANHYVVTNVTCDDGYSGEVLAPVLPAQPGFFDEEMDGLGIRRAVTVTVNGAVVYTWQHPCLGFYDELVNCAYVIKDPAGVEPDMFYVVKVQRIYTGGG